MRSLIVLLEISGRDSACCFRSKQSLQMGGRWMRALTIGTPHKNNEMSKEVSVKIEGVCEQSKDWAKNDANVDENSAAQ